MICPISKYKQNSQRGLAVAHAKSELVRSCSWISLRSSNAIGEMVSC